MLILSRVCAEFHNAKGEFLFAVTPSALNVFVTAPDAIREDPLFRMLVSDGSLEAAVPEERKRVLEQDPAAGHDAAGKAIQPAPENEPGSNPEEKPEEKPARSGRTKAASSQ